MYQCQVKVEVEVCNRIASGLSRRYYLSTAAIIWDGSGGDMTHLLTSGANVFRRVFVQKNDILHI